MKVYKLLLIYFIFSNSLLAQTLTSNGARAEALANSTGASINFWNIKHNPSTVVFLDEISFGIDIKNNFMIKELTTATLAFMLPVNKLGTFSFYYQHYGYSGFNQNKLAISYSKKISKFSSASIQINDNIQTITSSEESKYTEHLIGFNIGLFTKLNDYINLASYYNFEKNINLDNENSKQELALALSWLPISELNIFSEISLKTNSNLSLRGGVEYKILNKIIARIGISSEPLNLSLGIGILFKNIIIDISATHNQYLGTGSNFSGNYIFRNTFNN